MTPPIPRVWNRALKQKVRDDCHVSEEGVRHALLAHERALKIKGEMIGQIGGMDPDDLADHTLEWATLQTMIHAYTQSYGKLK